jgi:ABC-type transporter Mla subunit MlaD
VFHETVDSCILYPRNCSRGRLVSAWKTCKPRGERKSILPECQRTECWAAVRVDGVNVGTVTSVYVRPERSERPIEVLMAIRTSYDLAIPNDSLVTLTTDGVLGPTVADIDTRHAHGGRVANNGVLTSTELTQEEAAQATKRIKDAIIKAVDKALPDAPTTNSSSKQTDSAK